jgi:ERCC4-related helicase
LQRDLGVNINSLKEEENTKNNNENNIDSNKNNEYECVVRCNEIVCVVVDEAHKATGMHPNVVCIREIERRRKCMIEEYKKAMDIKDNEKNTENNSLYDNNNPEHCSSHEDPGFRIVGLSATPGNSHNDIQQVIYNLRIAHIEGEFILY